MYIDQHLNDILEGHLPIVIDALFGLALRKPHAPSLLFAWSFTWDKNNTIIFFHLQPSTEKLIEFVKYLQCEALNKRHIEFIEVVEEMQLIKELWDIPSFGAEMVIVVHI